MSCKCQNLEKTEIYECGKKIDNACPDPCPHGEFFCKERPGEELVKKQCIPQSYKCNSINSCGNWKDEEGCHIPRDDLELLGRGKFHQL